MISIYAEDQGVFKNNISNKNAVVVYPGEDVMVKYDWLKASARDGEMGALSNTNRRTLILAPGQHILPSTQTLTLDTNFVDVTSMTPGDPGSTVISGLSPTSYAAVKQTALNVQLSGFAIIGDANTYYMLEVAAVIHATDGVTTDSGSDTLVSSAGTDLTQGVVANAGDDAGLYDEVYLTGGGVAAGWYKIHTIAGGVDLRIKDLNLGSHSSVDISVISQHSLYDHLHFPNLAGGTVGVYITEHMGGRWFDCQADGCSWFTNAKDLKPYMYRCLAGKKSFGGDMGNKIEGFFLQCKGGDESFGGCTSQANIIGTHAVLIECESGDRSYSLGNKFEGKAYRCTGGVDSFAGYTNSATNKFQGYAEDCVAHGNSFGMGNASSELSGVLVRCRNGSIDNYKAGTSGGVVTTFSGICKNCYPWVPTACTANTTVRAFDNGHTYTNEGAQGSVEFTLPVAKKGMKYTFVKIAQQDVLITPDGSETIDGAADMDDTTAESDKFITLVCYEDGEWLTYTKSGTWA